MMDRETLRQQASWIEERATFCAGEMGCPEHGKTEWAAIQFTLLAERAQQLKDAIMALPPIAGLFAPLLNAATARPWAYALNVGPTKALLVEPDGSTIVEIENRFKDGRRFESIIKLIVAAVNSYQAAQSTEGVGAPATAPLFEYKGEFYVRPCNRGTMLKDEPPYNGNGLEDMVGEGWYHAEIVLRSDKENRRGK